METVWVTVYEEIYVMTKENYAKLLHQLSTLQSVKYENYGTRVAHIEANVGTMSSGAAMQRLAEINRATKAA